MPQIPIGTIILLVVSLLIYFGVAQRVLDKLRLSDKAALGVIGALIIGSFINIPLPSGPRVEASINIGGAVVPLILAGYLIYTTSNKERLRSVVGTIGTAAAIYLTGLLLPAQPEAMVLDPLYIYPLVGGIIAYVIGRSRRGAFIAATMGILLFDVLTYFSFMIQGSPGAVLIGGGGAFDAIVIAGLLAVLLAEFIGESRERLQGGPTEKGKAPALLKRLRPLSPNKVHQEKAQHEEEGEKDEAE
ncbi:MAG: DUF1614 domain-containing protein [Syntrophaceticus sp.]|nr:DUF1614 domain-containing protein [Syntrophaceticus sp.]